MLNLVIDENISFAEEVFGQFGKVRMVHGRSINNEMLRNCDALIVRSITDVNKELLHNTRVKFVGTATIGTDHIDLQYLKENKIAFSSAKSCNADAVAEYVFTAVSVLAHKKFPRLEGLTIAVIGYGNIGTRVVRYARALGMNVLINDPPLERAGVEVPFTNIEEALKSADIITLHVPLNRSGIDKTVHLLDEKRLSLIKNGALIINAARGPVVDNKALLQLLSSDKDISAVLDVWEKEPVIEPELLEKVDIGSAHIAGYSLEGKVNGTVIIANALASFVGQKPVNYPLLPEIENPVINVNGAESLAEALNKVFSAIYDIRQDDILLRNVLEMPESERVDYFDYLRKSYHFRREFSNYTVNLKPYNEKMVPVFRTFRFNVKSA